VRVRSGSTAVTVTELARTPLGRAEGAGARPFPMGNAGTTTMSTVAWPLGSSVPRSQRTVVVPAQAPWLGVADSRVTPGGSTSEKVTAPARAGRGDTGTLTTVPV